MNRLVVLVFSCATLIGCNDAALVSQKADTGRPAGGLRPDQAARVLARVGDQTITLGEFARVLERMDQFDRIKYQSRERRRELLDEMVDAELLATEAKRLGLDKEPATQAAVRLLVRDALLAEVREGIPTPAEIPTDEVKRYYESHLDAFRDPERRRVSAIILTDRAAATSALKEAHKAKSPTEWGELVRRYSRPGEPGTDPSTPLELAGDLGIVGPLGDANGGNPAVATKVREAVFKLSAVSDVAPELVEDQGRFYVVRLTARIEARARTLAESDRAIRVLVAQTKIVESEKRLEEELRRQFPVQVDDRALATVELPSGVASPVARASTAAAPPEMVDGGK